MGGLGWARSAWCPPHSSLLSPLPSPPCLLFRPTLLLRDLTDPCLPPDSSLMMMRPARGITDDGDHDETDTGIATLTRRCLQGGSEKANVVAPLSVTLVSSQGDSFQVDGKVAMMSELVKTMIGGTEDEGGSSNGSGGSRSQEIPLPNVKTEVLVKVIEYCKHHVDHPVAPIQKPLVDSDMKKVSRVVQICRS